MLSPENSAFRISNVRRTETNYEADNYIHVMCNLEIDSFSKWSSKIGFSEGLWNSLERKKSLSQQTWTGLVEEITLIYQCCPVSLHLMISQSCPTLLH